MTAFYEVIQIDENNDEVCLVTVTDIATAEMYKAQFEKIESKLMRGCTYRINTYWEK